MNLVERSCYLSMFDKAAARCETGAGSTISITGPLASGKTSLLDEFAARAANRGFLVVPGAGSRTERHLPLGLVNQFCHGLPPLDQLVRDRLIRDVQTTALSPAVSPELGDRRLAHVLHAVSDALREASELAPVLLTVDDLHHADPMSLRCLLYLARRIGQSRVIMVMCGRGLGEPTDPLLYSDLVNQAPRGPLSLPLLTSAGIGRLLSRRLGDVAESDPVVTAALAATGGNPLLVEALANDLTERAAPRAGLAPLAGPDPLADIAPPADIDASWHVSAGDGYARAVLRCLERCTAELQRILRAAAVLDEELPAGLMPLGHLSSLDVATVERGARELAAAGLLRAGRLPHPRARQAILDSMPAAELARLHLQAARLLQDDGAPPVPVARHLLLAGHRLDPSWVPVLHAAATQLLDEADTALAVRFLRLAHSVSADSTQRADVRAALLRAEWRTDPTRARHQLPHLVAMAGHGTLSVPHLLLVARCLLWFGQAEEATAVLDRLVDMPADATAQGEIRFTRAWAGFAYPELVGLPESEPAAGTAIPRHRTSTSTGEALAQVLTTVVNKGPNSQAVTAAEQALQRCVLDDDVLAPISASLAILMQADQLETAALWSDRLLAQAVDRKAPSWQAVFHAIRGDVSLRQGRLLDAYRHADTALSLMSRESWATALGAPLATLLHVLTARGRLDEAARQLEQPMPDETFRTIWGLGYLQARGRFYLAAGRPDAALDDFLTCGDLMDRWNVDQPAIVPWRLDAAQAYQDLGDPRQARTMVEIQFTKLDETPTRARGLATRLLAATSTVARRITLLRESAEIMRRIGDQLELARTLADLSHAYQAAGDSLRARTTVRRAWHLATECDADALRQVLLPDFDEAVADTAAEARGGTDAASLSMLSEAERRVAALAAQGHTNRQIANKLFVTVSTVEQHLTRVYRKLKVNRRNDLLAKLPAEFSTIA
ncbi:helix-turn-helix transcriptional regulator [Parafrankia discariae]|uniref:helix-turn-helix transcriptional regulator n=1 Tax=Parafrankia discariae TaxID=365528 RepID=UPI000363D0CB|nr:LuxR family transcriptional regulator [Parafrankia discariae]